MKNREEQENDLEVKKINIEVLETQENEEWSEMSNQGSKRGLVE